MDLCLYHEVHDGKRRRLLIRNVERRLGIELQTSMFDTGDHSYNFTFNELSISIEQNADRFSSGKIGTSERFIYYEHLRCVLAIAIVEQTSLLQLHSCRLEERRCHYAVIGDSFVGLLIVRFTCDP